MPDYLKPSLSREETNAISTLGLAHMGDAVFETMVRTWLCANGRVTSRGLHRETVSFVSAPAQARAFLKIQDMLTESEANMFRKGRNTRVNSVPHGAAIAEYHAATGLEALFGWLYLKGERDRLNELFAKMMEETDAT